MQTPSEWLSGLSATDPSLWLALGSGLLVILVFLVLGRRRARRFRAPIVPPVNPVPSPDWETPPAMARSDERRRSIRRGGLPTPILVVDAKRGTRGKATEAYVLDRSTGGLRLALERAFPAGSSLLAKPGNAPEGFEWVKLVVRNCREVGDYYELGCQFESDLELSRLLMFG